ncbi:MAG: DUF115 domain-containing protein [Treponema sp.]|nr:DUF115 domain-containing protein [Treponema sp.]
MINQKPCIVETTQGFSLSYKNHLLYSKYNPAKNIIKKIEDLSLLPGSVILCLSPALNYGIKELLAKLPEDCILLLCEADKDLFAFSQDFRKSSPEFQLPEDKRLQLFDPEQLADLPLWLYKENHQGKYRRLIPIDFSAGTSFHPDFYKSLSEAATKSIMTFWKNRVTLTKFGRKYCRNFFRNLQSLKDTKPIEVYFKQISSPIICFGAGESTDYFFEDNPHFINNKDKFFILCADTALAALTERGICPDGIFLEEAQSVILKSFIGNSKNPELHIFAGLSSIPNLSHIYPKNQLSYFFTEFTQAAFIDRAEKEGILPIKNPAFGSVGLTMVYYALRFRSSENIPVYFTGLDFSYSAGRTHTRASPHFVNKLLQKNKITSEYDFYSSFNQNALKFTDKSGKSFYTSQILSSYSQFFAQYFYQTKNLFDAGKSGIPMGFSTAVITYPEAVKAFSIPDTYFSNDKIDAFINKEREALIELRELLSKKQDLTQEELKEKITRLAEGREYLFLHYPDGLCFKYEQSFLNRVRTEIDFFLKCL